MNDVVRVTGVRRAETGTGLSLSGAHMNEESTLTVQLFPRNGELVASVSALHHARTLYLPEEWLTPEARASGLKLTACRIRRCHRISSGDAPYIHRMNQAKRERQLRIDRVGTSSEASVKR